MKNKLTIIAASLAGIVAIVAWVVLVVIAGPYAQPAAYWAWQLLTGR